MRFDLDEQQRAFQLAVTEYLEAECPTERALAAHDAVELDLGIWRGLMELGIGGLVVPEEHGGLGLGLLDLAVIAEPVGRFAAPGPFIDHALATIALAVAASDKQKAAWLPLLASGAKRATVALAEAKGDWTADRWTLDGEDTLTGTKRYVLNAEGADLIVVGLANGALGLVEASAPGLAIEVVLSTDGGKRLSTLSFSETPFERLPVAAGARLVDAGLVLLAADAFGGASACVDRAVSYAKEREQFGQPIGAFQAMKHQLADMALSVAPTIGLYWYAAHLFDTGEAAAAAEAAALAKAHIAEVYPRIARRMIEAHGGIGYTWEFGDHVWLKRALFDQVYLGSPRQHRMRIAKLAGW